MKINLKKSKTMQTIYGFGTSSCWWSQYCKDKKSADEIAELLYGKSGLGLNIYRYNIGGGFDKDNVRVENPWRRSESLYVFDKEEEKGEYDFSLDKTARDMMDICIKKDTIDTVILFANSPHYSQTSSGQASGSMLYHTCNLPMANYEKFAKYFLDITEHFINCGIPVKYISPINEPQWKWGGTYVWQEGCHYETQEILEVFRAFAKELDKRNLDVMLYGPESGEMGGPTQEYINALKSDENVMKYLKVFAYHSYHDDDKPETRYWFKKELVEKNKDIRFDMSEWCELPNKSHTKSINGALITARVIGQDLVFGGARSWTSWVGVNQFCIKEDGLDYSDGLITANDDFSSWYVAKRYYGIAHFSKFIPVNSKCIDINFLPQNDNKFNAFAFLTPKGETVIVFVNEGENETVEIAGDFKSIEIVESTDTVQLKQTYKGEFKSRIEINKNSLVTVVLNK